MSAIDQYLPLVPTGHRISAEAEAEMFVRLDQGWSQVLVREYAGTNAATTAAYKLTHNKKWSHTPPPGKSLEFFTRAKSRGGPYGVYAQYVKTGDGRG